VTVPNNVVWGVAFDTETWGAHPVNYDGPFDSLNPAVTPSVSVGTDANPGGALLDSTEAGQYYSCYSGPNYTGALISGCPTGSFRDDPSGWVGYVPAAQFVVAPATNANCADETLPPGDYQNVTAGANCVINSSDDILGNVMVQKDGTLQDIGAAIGGNLQANNADWVDIGQAGTVGGDLQVQGLTGKPSGTGDGATANDLCNTTVGGNVQVQNNGPGAPFEIGSTPDCGAGLTIGGNLQVQNNAGEVIVGTRTTVYNHANGNIQVQNNTGGGRLAGNSAGGDCQLQNDKPGIVGSDNSAGAKHQNTCNATA